MLHFTRHYPLLVYSDRIQTVNNVMGDAYCAGIINHMAQKLHLLDDDQNGSIKNGNTVGAHFGREKNGITSTTTF